MSRILCFGDSWTKGHGVEKDVLFKENPKPPTIIDKLREQNSWPHYLSHLTDRRTINFGECGIGNKRILDIIKETLDTKLVEKDDHFIIMLSYPYRDSNIIDVYNEMEKVLSGYNRNYYNSFYKSFLFAEYDKVDMFNFVEPERCMSDILREYEILNDISVWEYEFRSVWKDEQGLWSGDYHPNTLGYKLISKQIKNDLF